MAVGSSQKRLDPKKLFSPEEIQGITEGIQRVESTTQGEIRVKVVKHLLGDTRKAAVKAFFKEGMQKTAQRTGVMIYLALRRKKFEIVADDGIAEKVSQEVWNSLAAQMSQHFRGGRFYEGVSLAIEEVGKILSEHFPKKPGDLNELPDQPILG